MISLHPEPRKAVSTHAFMQIFGFTIRFPKGILALPKEIIFSPNGILALSRKNFFSLKGILASLKEIIICRPKEKWLLIRFLDRRTAN